MKIRLSLILLAGIIFCFTNIKAQNSGPPPVSKVQPVNPPSAGSLKAAEDMLVASGAAVLFEKNINAAITQYSAQVPEANRAKFVDVMQKFLTKYSSWDILKHDICMLYAREFTEQELMQLTAFYKTPLGIKLNEKQPVLMQAGMGIGQQAVMAHQDELQQMMAKVMK